MGEETHLKRFIFRFSCLRSLSDMWCCSPAEPAEDMSMDPRRCSEECREPGESTIELVEVCECGEPTPWAS